LHIDKTDLILTVPLLGQHILWISKYHIISFRFCFASCFIITPFPLLIKNVFVCLFLDDNVLSYVLVAYRHGILNNILRNHLLDKTDLILTVPLLGQHILWISKYHIICNYLKYMIITKPHIFVRDEHQI
jgi:hypothetical protein